MTTLLPKGLLEPLTTQGLSYQEIADRLVKDDETITVRRVRYAARQHGLRAPSDRRITTEEKEWIRKAREEGVLVGWLAETIGRNVHTVTEIAGAHPEHNSEWLKVWGEISHHPRLAALHRQFAPTETKVHSVRAQQQAA